MSPPLSPDRRRMGEISEPQSPAFGGFEDGGAMDLDPPVPLQLPQALDNILMPVPLVDHDRQEALIDANLDPELLAVADELEREFRFDQLLDENNQLRQHDWGDDGGNDHEGLGLGFENGADDVDFGLPNEPRLGANAAAEALPHFQLQNDLEPEDPEEGPDAGDGVNDLDALCAAFREPDLIRNAYIDALVQKLLYGATHRALKHQLKTARRTISAHPDIEHEHVTKMAQTITTVEHRLGVNTDDIIITFTLCPVCKRRYAPEYIQDTDNEHCLNEGCEGVLFVIRNLASGGRRRVSNLTYPYASVIAWLRHMLIQPGIAELMQTWRAHDDHGMSAPVSSQDWMHELNYQKPLGDIMDGWGWRSTTAGLHRTLDPETGDIVDVSEVDPPIRFVSLPFGISFSMNTDWFQVTKEGNYSVGGCYLVINNLPRHMRFLRENISLTIVMPGPKEPSSYALDQMLEPLIDELLKLKQGKSVLEIGVRIRVRRGDPPVYVEELVHGELSQQIADLIARIKMGGGAGIKSELNFCLYCHSRLSSLSVVAGYMRGDFRPRDTQEDLNNAYRWRTIPDHDARKDFFNATGNRFTQLHRLPGWHTSASSPLDTMHLLYLGGMNWIVKQVLVGPGMLARRHEHGLDPQDIFNNCLDNMWMPKNFQRLPPKASTSILDKRTITPADIVFSSELLETLCKDYVTHNVQLPPNFHYMMHLEEFLLKTASVYNTHVWGMERANGIVSRIKHNGKSKGVLEGTLMRGWWSHTTLQNLIKHLQALPNQTPADESVIEDLMEALRGGNEQAQRRGTLAAFIAQCQTEYTQKYGIQVSTTLSKQSRYIQLDRMGLYEIVLQFCVTKWPNAGIFGLGMVQNHYLAPFGMVRNHSYVEYNGIRYGSYEHTSGKGYCYGYINGRQAVRIERILAIDIPETEFHSICVLVWLFEEPEVEPNFPWDAWAENLGAASWAHGNLGDLVAVSVDHLSGTFALFDIPTTVERYWVTVALDSIGLEQEADDENE
ncbi:hypothetical protein FRC09_004399 [Ceratobasidium sp. 395]|nr:hypothetical protein FRC09_004399 [Ceratobasidium sp. 395]